MSAISTEVGVPTVDWSFGQVLLADYLGILRTRWRILVMTV